MWGNLNQELRLYRYFVFAFIKVRCPEETLKEITTKYRRQRMMLKKISLTMFLDSYYTVK